MHKEDKRAGRKKSKADVGAVVVFIAIISVFTMLSVFMPKSDFSEAENRALKERPELAFDTLLSGDYQEEYETYLSDQFVGREFFVALTTRLALMTGKKDVNGVYLGAEDYLIEKYAMSDFDEMLVSDNIWYLSEFLTHMVCLYGNQHVQCMLIPSKGTALSGLLPDYAEPFDSRFVVDELKQATADTDDASADGLVFDLTETLAGHSDEYIYYRTDHHWTTLGAFYAYQAYQKLRGETPVSPEAYTVDEVTDAFLGTTYDKVQLECRPDSINVYRPKASSGGVLVTFDDGAMVWDGYYDDTYLEKKDKYSYFFGGNTAKIQITTGAGNGKCLLLLKDSFSNSFVEFLESDYEFIYMVDLRYAEGNIYDLMEEIDAEHAISDVLVMYNTEKLMQDDNLWKLEK